MENVYQRKLDEAEQEYRESREKLDQEIEYVLYEKRQFRQDMEGVVEQLSYEYQQADFCEPLDLKLVYRLLDESQDEGEVIVKEAIGRLEEKKEELKEEYRRIETRYQDELISLVKEKEST